MKKNSAVCIFLVSLLACSVARSEPPIFKEKKFFGPIPFNSVSVAFGFLDGANFDYLTEHFDVWAKARNGFDTFGEISTSPYGRISYERQLTPNHFFKGSAGLSYLHTSSVGYYVAARPDTNYELNMARTFKVYLFSLEGGFSYYFASPEPQSFSPYVGAGFSAVFPMVRLETECTKTDGRPYNNPEENVSRDSFEAGWHMELGLHYFISNRFAAGLEGKYQMAQSRFYIHGGNFDLSYAGFMLSLSFTHYL